MMRTAAPLVCPSCHAHAIRQAAAQQCNGGSIDAPGSGVQLQRLCALRTAAVRVGHQPSNRPILQAAAAAPTSACAAARILTGD